MSYQVIEQGQWRDFLDGFMREHLGWLVTVKYLRTDQLSDDEATQVPASILVRHYPLEDIRESERENGMDIMLTVGSGQDENSILIESVHHLYLHKADSADKGLRIDSTDDTTTLVEFRAPMLPENVDGLAEAER
ncbi:hypothetical protein Tel_12605 [Candidatus Tenderia electrophaga]|jgi:hypothetical protein|uniref:Uncharacterized protein n=1 Tax=Candidatus Tenderia electrophaga TaxID=1748243 RepID=A0A0S2TFJ7_9GAMM|nr:hypothetical protein Tel_12605 [Candidatus Tenderia electrophaga]